MTPTFKKLNYKDQKKILVLNAPKSFDAELSFMADYASIIRNEEEIPEIEFALVFVTKKIETDEIIPRIYPKFKGDAVLWFCYPKGTSRKYTCDFNRDNGWNALKNYNLVPIRQIAIDDDWSALRFRNTEYIKTMTRKEENFDK